MFCGGSCSSLGLLSTSGFFFSLRSAFLILFSTGHTDLHAGHYENFIFYDAKEDYTLPALIHQSLDGSYKSAMTTQNQLPFLWDFLRGKITLVTNWSSFAKPNVIDGCLRNKSCTSSAHLILFPLETSGTEISE